MQQQMKLKINYWPILRTPNVSQNSLDGKNNDQVIVELNDKQICTFRLEKVNIPSNIYGHEEIIDIDFDLKSSNKFQISNIQKWEPTGESIELKCDIVFTPIKFVTEPHTYTEWEFDFKYDLTDLPSHELEKFNENFEINEEWFHFKLFGKALLYNQKLIPGHCFHVKDTFRWRCSEDDELQMPLMFEFEEFGNVKEYTAIKFVQGLRFTIYKE